MRNNEHILTAYINPLSCTAIEFTSREESNSIGAETILSFLCPPGTAHDTKTLVERYNRSMLVQDSSRFRTSQGSSRSWCGPFGTPKHRTSWATIWP